MSKSSVNGIRGIGYILVSEMGYTWEELKKEKLADALYTYAIWEKRKQEEQKEHEKMKKKRP